MLHIADATTIDFTSAVQWVQYGVLGVVVLGFIMGWIWPKPAVKTVLSDRDEARDELRQIQVYFRDVVVPAVVASNEAIKATNELVRDLARDVDRRTRDRDRARDRDRDRDI